MPEATMDAKAMAAEMIAVVKQSIEQQVRDAIAPLKQEIESLKSQPLVAGKDGLGISTALLNQKGELVLTFTDGSTQNVGKVVGMDGEKGSDGKDGLGFDDLSVEQDDERTVKFIFSRDTQTKTFEVKTPVQIYRGVYVEAKAYDPGDTVTWAGSLWHCNAPTSEKPGGGSDWTLCAKKGRDGKDGKDGERGERGLQGERGRDLTQLGPDGGKW